MNEKPAMSKHLIIDINHIILIKFLPKKLRYMKENWLGLHRESGGGKCQSDLPNPNT